MNHNFSALPKKFIAIVFFLNCTTFYDTFCMDAEHLDDSNPLKKQFLLKQHATKNIKKNSGPITFFRRLPPELRDQVACKLIEDKDKATILPLSYALSYLDLPNKTVRELKNKIAVYHAIHIIHKMSSCKTAEERIALRKFAAFANDGTTFWNDIPEYSLWGSGIGFKCDLKRQLKAYVENSNKQAEDLDGKLQAFFEIPDNEEKKTDEISELPYEYRVHLIQGYYNTRSEFLRDAHQLEKKLREKANKILKCCVSQRYCIPLYCCYNCVGPLISSFLTNPGFVGIGGALSIASAFGCCVLASISATCCYGNGCLFNISFLSELGDHKNNFDDWKFLTGIPNTGKLAILTQKELNALKDKKDFQLL